MKLKETEIEFTTTPKSESFDNFAIECRRDRSFITKAVGAGNLNWGVANGIKMIVLDELAESFIDKCRAMDNHKRASKKAKEKN